RPVTSTGPWWDCSISAVDAGPEFPGLAACAWAGGAASRSPTTIANETASSALHRSFRKQPSATLHLEEVWIYFAHQIDRPGYHDKVVRSTLGQHLLDRAARFADHARGNLRGKQRQQILGFERALGLNPGQRHVAHARRQHRRHPRPLFVLKAAEDQARP